MIVVSGVIEIESADLQRALAAGREAAVATRAEPGCRAYAFYQDIETPARIRLFEEWDDAEALKRHFEMPHFRRFREVLGGIRVLGREIKRYEIADVTTM
jgi:quinol monooxygenase YgiN